MESNNYQQNNSYSDSLLTGKGAQPTVTNVETNSPSQNSSLDLVYWIAKLVKYWYFLLIGVVLAGGLAMLQNKRLFPIYLTTTTVLIQSDSKAANIGPSFGSSSNQNNKNQLLIYSSYDLIARTVEKMNITNELFYKGKFKNTIYYKNGPIEIESNFISGEAYGMIFRITGLDNESYEISFAGNKNRPEFKITGEYGRYLQHQLFFILVNKTNAFRENFDLHFRFVSKDELIIAYKDQVRPEFLLDGSSSVMTIGIVGAVYQRDIDFLTLLNSEFQIDNLTRKNESSQRAIDFINEQMMVIRDSIIIVESKLNEFQAKTGLFTQNQTSSAHVEMEVLIQKKAEIRLQREYLDDLGNYLRRNTHEILVPPSAMGVSDGELARLVAAYNETSFQLRTLGPANPLYRRYTMQIEDTKTALNQAIQAMLRTLRIEERNIEERYDKIVREMVSLPERERELMSKERDFRILDAYNEYLQQRLIESKIQRASNAPDNQVLDQPRMIRVVNKDTTRDTYILYIAIFLGIFVIFVVSKELIFNFTIHSREELEKFGLPILGLIERSERKNQMIVHAFPKSGFAEGFRNLRSRMEYVVKRERPISMLLTSTEPKDGKTFIAVNLASIYQLTGRRTIIVDCDLRRPAMSKSLGVGNEKGLSNYLIGQVKLEDVIITHPDYGFDVISAGTIPPNPSELIRSKKTVDLIAKLSEMYDYMVLDCSPIGLVSDAHFLARHVDVLLYVVRNEKTNKNFLRHTIKELKDDNMSNMVLIYNDVNLKAGYSNYGNQRYYGKSSYYLKHSTYYHNEKVDS